MPLETVPISRNQVRLLVCLGSDGVDLLFGRRALWFQAESSLNHLL